VAAVELVVPRPTATGGWRTRTPFPVLLTCEHASNELPPGYSWAVGDARLRDDHWAYDPGARALCLELQNLIGCPAVLSRFSRLFCDINREDVAVAGDTDSFSTTPFLTVAEDRPVLLNSLLDEVEMEQRLAGAWRPYHRTLQAAAENTPEGTLIFSIHTFTRCFNPGRGQPVIPRTTEVGILCRPATDLAPGQPAQLLLERLLGSGVVARINDPCA
jgi:predicted N-formylglutamate amidohydrolase